MSKSLSRFLLLKSITCLSTTFDYYHKDEYVKVEKNKDFVSHITFKTPPYLDPEQRVSSDDDDDFDDQPIKVYLFLLSLGLKGDKIL